MELLIQNAGVTSTVEKMQLINPGIISTVETAQISDAGVVSTVETAMVQFPGFGIDKVENGSFIIIIKKQSI